MIIFTTNALNLKITFSELFLFFGLGGMSDLQHLPLCDPEDEVLPFEFVPARGNTEESNRKVSDKSKALSTSRPSGIAVARSGIYLILVFFNN